MASKEVSPLCSPTEETDQLCSLCNQKYEQPRVLSCLHVYCQACLEKPLQNSDSDEAEQNSGRRLSVLKCPGCEQETKIPAKGVAGLPLDYVTCNQLDMSAIENMQIVCTSCKAREKAVARCSDCATFLCSHCVTAHQYMRCFENHKVVSFENLKMSGDLMSIHKPITCTIHVGEVLKFYCHSCQTPICNECIASDHKHPDHHYERASEVEQKQREELRNLITESKSKVQYCEEATTTLGSCLTELQMQRDNAKSLIQETFQSYKAMLEKKQESLLQELEALHAAQELHVMDTFHCVEKTIDKIEDACKFADRLLKHGNTVEVLSLKQLVGSQLLYLINNTPKPDISVDIKFETDASKFEAAINSTFGYLKNSDQSQVKEGEATPSQHPSPIHSSSSFETDGFALPAGVLSPDNSIPSSLDLTNNVIAQYNIAQLANVAETSASRSSTTPSPLTLSDLLIPTTGSDAVSAAAQLNALNNLSALAKLGSVSLNNAVGDGSEQSASVGVFSGGGQILLNGQVVPGLSIDTINNPRSNGTMGAPSPHSQTLGGIQSPLDTTIGGIMNGNPSIPQPPHRGSPHLNSPLVNGGSGMNISIPRGISHSSLLSSNIMSQLPSQPSYNPLPRSAVIKLSPMQIRCKFGQLGPGKGQFSSPHGFCLGPEEEIIVADTNNHRIQVFDKTGEYKYFFGVAGKEEGQLWYPRKVAVICSSGKYVICDRGNERSRMQIFTKSGHFIKKIAIRYIDIVAGLAITTEGHIVAVDSVSPTVFVIAETGDLLRWFDCSEYMREPSDIAIRGKEYYICDFKGHCVIVFSEEGQYLRRIGHENVTNFPNGIDISDDGDVLVGDSHGNRFHVVVFSRDGTMVSEFECPYVKVSRCCGLKITSEGYIVTLAKNNHHVLILNTLYVL